jgi:excisionase family DNA binding protein
MALVKIRSIKEAYELIMRADPESSLSYYHFRRTVLSGTIPFFKSGNKYLVNYADVEKYYCGGQMMGQTDDDEYEKIDFVPHGRRAIRRISA